MRISIVVLFVAGLMLSCNKDAGRGGTSSVYGKVHVYNINGIGDTLGEFDGMDEDVYIIYGDADETYDDKFSCSYDGSFRFDYLTEGTYRVFAYSRCDTCDDGVTPVFKTIEINEKKTEFNVGNIYILK
jgi:hypothetical protein